MKHFLGLIALLIIVSTTYAAIDAVERWTIYVDDEIMPAINFDISNDLDSTYAARVFAMLHATMFDTYNCFVPLTPKGASLVVSEPTDENYTCDTSLGDPVAAAHAAAATILTFMFPELEDNCSALLQAELALLPSYGTPEQQYGVDVGIDIATAVWNARLSDGFTNVTEDPWIITGNNTNGIWRPTPPSYGNFTTAGYARMTPFAIPSLNYSRPPPPPHYTTHEYALSFNQVKSLGAINSTTRTAEQTENIIYWGAKNSANRWFDVCLAFAAEYNTTLEQNLVLYTLVSLAQMDATLASFDHKIYYLHWRPVSAIHSAAADENNETESDPDWAPYRPSEATPDYPSTVSSACSSSGKAVFNYASGVLGVSDDIVDVTLDGRTFTTISEIIWTCGMSRIYQGVHFGFSVEAGAKNGYAVADYIYTTTFGLGETTDLPLPNFAPVDPPNSPEPAPVPSEPEGPRAVSPLGWVGITLLIVVIVVVIFAAVVCCTPLKHRIQGRCRRSVTKVDL